MSQAAARELLVCPACHGRLQWESAAARCDGCGAVYLIEDQIPVLRSPVRTAQTEAQEAFFDEADPDWETNRPHGAPRWHRFLLAEKLRRGVSELGDVIRGATAVSVCGGSGMEAEFLARCGAEVITADISVEAARRARRRGRKFGVEYMSIVADAEALPFRERSVDLAFVHDGLHHLDRPLAGLAEMARVSRVAVSVNEPARAALTAVAVKARIAQEVEAAGNRVERLDPREVVTELQTQGFHVVCAQRYAMFYRHEPGLPSSFLSQEPVFGLARAAFRLANVSFGSFGNKLTVQAIR